MPPIEPLTVALPLALIVLIVGWRAWRREHHGVAPAVASAIVLGLGWLASSIAAAGMLSLPPKSASQKLLVGIAASLLLAPLELRGKRRLAFVVHALLALGFLAWVLPPFAKSYGWSGPRQSEILGAAWVGWLALRFLAERALARPLHVARGAAAFGLVLLGLGVAQAIAGSMGLATGFSGAAVGAFSIAVAGLVRKRERALAASAGVLTLLIAGGTHVALLSVPAFHAGPAALLLCAPWAGGLYSSPSERLGKALGRLLPVLLCVGAALAWTWLQRSPSPYG